MSSQGSGAGPQRPRDSWGRPAGAPQQPGPESVYEVPEDFEDAAAGGSAAGGGWSADARSSRDPRGASPVPGMSAKDFQKMCRSVDKAFSQFAKAVEKGVDEAAEALGQSPEDNLEAYRKLQKKRERKAAKRAAKQAAKQAARAQAQAQAQAAQAQAQAARGAYGRPGTAGSAVGYAAAGSASTPGSYPAAPTRGGVPAAPKGRFRPTWGLTASGVVLSALGGVGTFTAGTLLIFALATGLVVAPGGVVGSVILGALTAFFGWALIAGIRRVRTASSLKTFQRIFGAREVCTFDELASRAQVKPTRIRAWAKKLLRRGLIPQGRIDDEETCLMVTDGAWNQYRQLQASRRQQLQEQQEAERAAEAARAAAPAAPAPAPTPGGTSAGTVSSLPPEARGLIEAGRSYLSQMRALDAAIDDAAVSAKIVALEDVAGRILARVQEEPSLATGLQKFSDYYLPTTVRLLEAYESLEEEPVQGDNIAGSRREIEQTLEVLHNAFQKLLDDTYQSMTMDVSADISVLTAMLAQEGLTENPFERK